MADDGYALKMVNDAPIREFDSGMLSGFHFFSRYVASAQHHQKQQESRGKR